MFWVAVLLAGAGWFVLSRTVFGRLIYVLLDAYRLRLARKLAVTQPAQAPTPAKVPS